MAEEHDDDVLDLTPDDQVDDDNHDDGEHDDADPQGDDGEDVLLFAGEDGDVAPADEPDLVKHLRKEIRERDKQLSAARRQQPQAEEPIVVGPRPGMWDDGIEGDEDKFNAALDAHDQRREAKRQQDQRREEAGREQRNRWQQVTTAYQDKKRALPFADKEEVERAAFEALSEMQQAVIASVAENPALVIYATKNPSKLAELSAIDDPLKLARAIGKLEAGMTVGKKRARPPEPDRPVRGQTISMTNSDKKLADLEKEADRTGDRTKVQAFKRAQKERSK